MDDHTHAFHSYPARMHPTTARRLVAALSLKGEAVLDPFCGSGTVLVEARAAGRVALGGDVHPLAVRLALLKSRSPPPGFRAALVGAARRVSGRAIAATKRSRGEPIPGFRAARSFWQPHVARDLLALRESLHGMPPGPVRDALWLVLSSIAVKVSDRASDTDEHLVVRRVGAGAVMRLFVEKATELGGCLAAFGRVVPRGTPQPSIEVRDARGRSTLGDTSVALALTSPPYPGTYDYADSQAMRVWLLRLDASGAAAAEIGARRHEGRGWADGMAKALAEVARALRPGGRAVLMVGDGIDGQRPVDAAHVVEDAGRRCGLVPLAAAFQVRPTRSGVERRVLGPEKRETLVALGRGPGAPST